MPAQERGPPVSPARIQYDRARLFDDGGEKPPRPYDELIGCFLVEHPQLLQELHGTKRVRR
jgi:hypothetical protein